MFEHNFFVDELLSRKIELFFIFGDYRRHCQRCFMFEIITVGTGKEMGVRVGGGEGGREV